MKKVFHLSTCSTCKRILGELSGKLDNFELQDIKSKPVEESEIAFIHEKLGSYEAFFNKRAMKYKSMGLKEIIKQDSDYKEYLLMDYTFLKRPLFIIDDQVIAGNAKKDIEQVKAML